jgi:beta-glucosidase
MPTMKTLKPLLLLASGLLAAPACSLDPPKFTITDASIGGSTCSSSSGGVDGGGGSANEGTIFIDPIVCGSTSSPLKDQLKAHFKYAPGYQPFPADQQTVANLMSQMTLDDKTTQMYGTTYGSAGKLNFSDFQRSYDTPASGIRGYLYRDASRGMDLGEDMLGALPNAAKVNGSSVGYSTAFPVSMARGAAFDLDLEHDIGEAIADEMMAAKQTLLLAPCMNLLRNPLWGRAQETYGEDPFQIGRLASAMAVGVQEHIAANAKHFMGYDIENGRDANNVVMDEQTLREIYGRHFRMVAQDGGVASFMASYNLVNGTKAALNRHILTDVLRTDFGFQGFVLSDWWAMPPGTNVSGVDTGTLKTYALDGMSAGLDVELPWKLNYGQLKSLVGGGGGLTMDDIDVAVGRILGQKVRFNSWDLTKSSWGLGSPKSTYKKSRVGGCGFELHKALAEKAALESMVLLKNAGNTLPINPSFTKVAVLGATVSYTTTNAITSTANLDFATDVNTGDMGSSRVFPDPDQSVGPFKGIHDAGVRRGLQDADIWSGSTADDVKDADFVVVVAGLTAGDEGEEYTGAKDRSSFGLDSKPGETANLQNNLIASVAALGKPMVVVLEGGSVIDMPWLDQVPAAVMAWYPGMRGGEALAQLLWGEVNFSAKLPITWGRDVSDYEQLKGENGTTTFDYYVGYSRFDHYQITPLFEFGYGLSYTTFKYDDLTLGCGDLSEGGILPVYVTVENTGAVAGDEIVMVWVSYPESKVQAPNHVRPKKELKGFTRVSLDVGEKKQVLIPIRLKDLDYYDQVNGQWVVEDGTINIMVGGSSTNLPLSGTVNVHGYAKTSSNY